MVCLLILSFHIGAGIYFHFFPASWLAKTPLGSFYLKRILVGPFFIAERIQKTGVLLVSHKEKGSAWTMFDDHGTQNFNAYYDSPWRYDKLMQAATERHFALKLARAHVYQDDKQYQKQLVILQAYVKEFISSDADSVRLVYLTRTFQPQTDAIQTDTLWKLTYAPRDISNR
jgi:hypothetical protein